MTPITQQELEQLNYNRFSWNNDAVIEWWKKLYNKDSITKSYYREFDYRLGVRFGEWKGIPFIVYLVYPHSIVSLEHIKTIEQLEQLYELLREPSEVAV